MMVGLVVEWLVRMLLWWFVLPFILVVVGGPAALWVVARQSRGGLVAFAGWILGVRWGLLPEFGGPFGVPSAVFWGLVGLFGVWWAFGFVTVGLAAWREAAKADRLMRRFGMPASEIC